MQNNSYVSAYNGKQTKYQMDPTVRLLFLLAQMKLARILFEKFKRPTRLKLFGKEATTTDKRIL